MARKDEGRPAGQVAGMSRLRTTILSARKSPLLCGLIESYLFLRGLVFAGRRYTCPCCGWKIRAFTTGGVSFRTRALSYCPRCHAKSRHRRAWLFLEEHTALFSSPHSLLHVSPEYCLSRRLRRMPGITYSGADLENSPHAGVRMDLTKAPFLSGAFDAALCIHVLEHIDDDRGAMRELFRVLKPGGWAVVSVPVRMDRKTLEDPGITTPEARERAYGETAHVRLYGYDLADRLRDAGFAVEIDLGRDIDPDARRRYGLRDDETIFFCTKA